MPKKEQVSDGITEPDAPEKTKNNPKTAVKAESSNVHSGHRQRMMKKYFANGINVFEEHEMLEIVLYSMFSRCNTNDIAHELIKKFGSLPKVFEASPEELTDIKGIGQSAAGQITFLGDFFRYLVGCSPGPIRLKGFPEISQYCLSIYTSETREHCYILFLDSKYCLISRLEIGSGTSSKAEVRISDVIKSAVRANASKAILVHNHPGSIASASVEDVFATRELASGLKNVDVDLIDHIIVSKDSIYSMNSKSGFKEVFER